MEKNSFLRPKNIILAVLLAIFSAIVILTDYHGSIDLGDYADSAKYFAGDLASKLRNSHSYLFGFIHAPLVKITSSFFVLKLSSLIFLALITYSVYVLSNRDKKALLLMLLSPVLWYMGPWINPIQISTLIFLWGYYFMNKYEESKSVRYLIFSGLLIGLSMCFWNTILYFLIVLGIVYLYDKKLIFVIFFFFSLLLGLLPLLLLDYKLFGFPFYSIIKTTTGTLLLMSSQGINKAGSSALLQHVLEIFLIIILIPIHFWKNLYNIKNNPNKRSIIFVFLSIIIILSNPQIRYILILAPIIILLIYKSLNEIQFKRQIIISIIITLIFISPYLFQVSCQLTNNPRGSEITEILTWNLDALSCSTFQSKLIQEDLNNISKDYSNQTFIVGNNPDDYEILAYEYWGKDIKEFVSIQDYSLYINNQTIIFEKMFAPEPKIPDRRQIWIEGGISKNKNDDTDYKNITLGIGFKEPLNLTGFKVVKKYDLLFVSKKI
jgi:hypothetical protein